MKQKIPGPIIAPCFRASTCISPAMRRLFCKTATPAEHIKGLASANLIFRHNCLRIFTASLVAQATQGSLVFVEGWSSNVIESKMRPPRTVTGSYMGNLILKFLQRAQLTPYQGPVVRRDCSCCTWQEIDAIAQFNSQRIIIVAHCPCPSSRRVSRYLKIKGIAHADVLSPHAILQSHGKTLSPLQQELVASLLPSLRETLQGIFLEIPNWVIHGTSHLSRSWFPHDRPLEVWLADKLRSA